MIRHSPKKNLGQHFLTDIRIQQKIIQACDFKDDDEVIEITEEFAKYMKYLTERADLPPSDKTIH